MHEHRLGPVSQIPAGEGRTFKIGGREVAVFHTRSGKVFATQAHCPHRTGPLADGMVGDSVLVCPLHEWRFDLATGSVLNGRCDIATYPVRTTEDQEILLTLAG
jgi:nitrite reductase (NADH) small subunit